MFKKYLDKAMEKYMEYVKTHIAYGIMESQQIARTNINLVNLSDSIVDRNMLVKHVSFRGRYDKLYVKVPAKFLVPGERLFKKDIRQLRYNLYSIPEINKLFGNTVDVFFNGKKIEHSEIRIALFDYFFIIEMPYKYKNHVTLNALIRPFVYDKIFTTNNITIPKAEINAIDDNNDFFLYVDNIQTTNFTIQETTNYYIINCATQGTKYEVCYIRHLNYYGKTSIKNNHINISDVKNKFPIAANNVITFANGLLVNLLLEAKTDGIFKCGVSINDKLDLFYTYKEYDFEEAFYYDHYRWLSEYLENFFDIIDNPNQLPEYINNFYLFREDISLKDFIENNYTDINEYNVDKSIKTIQWCEECFITILKFIYQEYMADNNLAVVSTIMDVSDYGKENLIRNDNTQEITDASKHATFNTSMVVIKLPNIEKYPYNIFIDGILYSDSVIKYREADIDYLYINANDILDNSYIEVEKVQTRYTELRKRDLIHPGGTKLTINNAISNGLMTKSDEYRYISVAQFYTASDNFINLNSNISNITYDAEKDNLLIEFKTDIAKNTQLRIYNTDFYQTMEYSTRRQNTGLEFNLTWLESGLSSVENLRVFKNGKQIPSSYYTVELPTIANKLDFPKISINVTYGIYELIHIQYTPSKFKELYYKDTLLTNGIVDIYNQADVNAVFFDKITQYFTMNGVRVTPSHYKYWCSKGVSVHDYTSVHHFCAVIQYDNILEQMINKFISAYGVHTKLLDKYIVGLMHDALDNAGDSNKPPLKDEDNVVDVDPARKGKVYYDLYNEFLKLNIINQNAKLPDYIMIKYDGLIDEVDDIIRVDADEKMLKWMPLNAQTINENDDSIVKILDLYYKLLEDMESTIVIDPNDIPDDIYETYKDLFDNNVLILQIPILE